MSLNEKGTVCVRCRSYLFDDDDIVYCPVCGAPHHRECYNALGHCALESLHGTPNEYSRKAEAEKEELAEKKAETSDSDMIKCRFCGEMYSKNLEKCPRCENKSGAFPDGFSGFDFLGGVPADMDLGDGVTAEEAKRFVLMNTHRYIPKFATLSRKHRVSWNWMAFLFPSEWMLSRKMYKGGIFAGILTVAATMLSYPLNLEIASMGITQSTGFYDTFNAMYEKLPQMSIFVVALAFAGAILNLGIRLFSAMFGDYMYKNYTISTIKKIRNEKLDTAEEFRKRGSSNFILFMLGFMIIQYAPVFILFFIS